MSLAKVLEEIKKVKPYADEDVNSGPVETLNGRRGRKNQAIERLTTLRQEYRQNMLDTAVFIIVTGDKREEFAEAAKNFKCFATDPNEFYLDLANQIPPIFYGGNASVNDAFDVLGRHLEDKARKLGIIGYPQLIFRQDYRVTLKSKEDLIDLTRRCINDQVGSEIVGLQALTSLVDSAIAADHSGKTTPIVLSTNDEKLALDLDGTLARLKPRGVFLVVAGKGTKNLKAVKDAIFVKDTSPEAVEATLKTINGAKK